MQAEPNAGDYARRLANTLKVAAEHRHLPTQPWSQSENTMAFDVDLSDADDLTSGFIARVVITVTPK